MRLSRFRLSIASPLLLLAFLLSGFFVACSKHGSPGSTNPPTPVDSLNAWKLMFNTGLQPQVEDVWFISPSTGFFLGSDNFVYMSTDSGRTWVKNAGSHTNYSMLYLYFVDSQHGYAMTQAEVETTNDGGLTWVLRPVMSPNNISILFTTPGTGYVGTLGGILKTTDTAKTWNQVYGPIGTNKATYPYFINAHTGYAFTASGYFGKSVDSGNTWATSGPLPITTTTSTFLGNTQFVDSLHGFFAAADGLRMTSDGGATWTLINKLVGGGFGAVKFFDQNTGYYIAGHGIYKTTDGGNTWTTSIWLTSDVFSGMHFLNATTGWAAASQGRIFRLSQ